LIDFPDLSTFAATLADRRFIAAASVAVLAGILRGYAGFGSALIYVPLVASIYEPRFATVSLILIDQVCVAPYAIGAFRHCKWREVLPAYIAAAVTVPFGIMVQRWSDPVILRWGMAVFVFTFVAIFASGWRYHWQPNAAAAMGAGALSGLAGGATQMSGPPVIFYWLGSPSSAAIMRSNLLAYLLLLGMTLLISYYALQPVGLGWRALVSRLLRRALSQDRLLGRGIVGTDQPAYLRWLDTIGANPSQSKGMSVQCMLRATSSPQF
jgi:uncharacterized membrane protein YfcA